MPRNYKKLNSELAKKALNEKWNALANGKAPITYSCSFCMHYNFNCYDNSRRLCPLKQRYKNDCVKGFSEWGYSGVSFGIGNWEAMKYAKIVRDFIQTLVID